MTLGRKRITGKAESTEHSLLGRKLTFLVAQPKKDVQIS
jgi:hypothetical protein